ncbi:MAG: Sjogren's syndrome/scleroderma autoantigen 1 family protein [Candidatus Odinarchaeota archaeon]
MNNDNIKKMADLLRSGNKMLNKACPVCNNPIFQNSEGLTFCPTCNREILIVDNKDNVKLENKIYINKKRDEISPNRYIEILNLLKTVLYQKIEMISAKLENEIHLQMLEKYTKVLSNIFDILNRISVLINKN